MPPPTAGTAICEALPGAERKPRGPQDTKRRRTPHARPLDSSKDQHYKDGLLNGYALGFAAARDRIVKMLGKEGKGVTAQRVA